MAAINPAYLAALPALREELARSDHRPISYIAAEMGVTKNALIGFLFRQGISTKPAVGYSRRQPAVRVTKTVRQGPTPAALASARARALKQASAARKFASTRADMRRLADEAIAAGRITKCPPGYALGSLSPKFERSFL